jgi:hypothetical protein
VSAHSVTTPSSEVASPVRTAEPVRGEVDRYQGIRQYSLKRIVAVWAAAALPIGVLAWVVAPLLEYQFSGPEPLIQSLLVCLTAGLAWQFVLVLILLRQEIGSFEWPRARCPVAAAAAGSELRARRAHIPLRLRHGPLLNPARSRLQRSNRWKAPRMDNVNEVNESHVAFSAFTW